MIFIFNQEYSGFYLYKKNSGIYRDNLAFVSAGVCEGEEIEFNVWWKILERKLESKAVDFSRQQYTHNMNILLKGEYSDTNFFEAIDLYWYFSDYLQFTNSNIKKLLPDLTNLLMC